MKQKMCVVFGCALIIVLSVFGFLSVSAASEQKYVTVVYTDTPVFFEIDENGDISGLCVEYLNKIAEYTGWIYQYIEVESTEEGLQMVADGKADMMLPEVHGKEAMEQFSYSSVPVASIYGSILTRKNNNSLTFEDYNAFSDITVGCVETTEEYEGYLMYEQEHNFHANMVYYDSRAKLVKALNNGEVDAAVLNLVYANNGFKVLGKYEPKPVYILTNRKNSQFMDQINSQMNRIRAEFNDYETQLMKKYCKVYYETPFTKSEQEYIDLAPEFIVGYMSGMNPLSYQDEEGMAAGISRDILDKIQENTGLKFTYKVLSYGEAIYEDFVSNNVDLVSSIDYNSKKIMKQVKNYTNSYLQQHKVLIGKKGAVYSKNDSIKIAIIGVNQLLPDNIRSAYPKAQMLNYSSITQALQDLKSGICEGLLINESVAEKCMSNPRYTDLAVYSQYMSTEQLCIAIIADEDDPNYAYLSDQRLQSILDKAISTITQTEISEIIMNEKMKNQYVFSISDFFYEFRRAIVGYMILTPIILVGIIYIYILKRRSHQRRIQNEKIMELQNQKYELLLKSSGNIVFDYDFTTQKITLPDKFFEQLGWTLPRMCELDKMYKYWNVHPSDEAKIEAAFEKIACDTDNITSFRVVKADKGYRWVRLILKIMQCEDKHRFLIGTLIDISDEVKERERLIQLSQQDKLTGLLNKESFYYNGQQYLNHNEAHGIAVIFMDLDNFKLINDRLGHMEGDKVIVDVASKLKRFFGQKDFISRFGGDEFCILAVNVTLEIIEERMKRIIEAIQNKYGIGDERIEVTSSIGIAYSKNKYIHLKNMLEYADIALYSSKQNGKNCYTFYEEGLKLNGYSNVRNS